METTHRRMGYRPPARLETFLRGMETQFLGCLADEFFHLETFLRGMETLQERFLVFRVLSLKPSLEGWKQRT